MSALVYVQAKALVKGDRVWVEGEYRQVKAVHTAEDLTTVLFVNWKNSYVESNELLKIAPRQRSPY